MNRDLSLVLVVALVAVGAYGSDEVKRNAAAIRAKRGASLASVGSAESRDVSAPLRSKQTPKSIKETSESIDTKPKARGKRLGF